jgi:hypothetical protein
MPRYVTRASVSIEDDLCPEDREASRSIVVLVSADAIDTGLVDALGVKIYRVAERVPMGFRRER